MPPFLRVISGTFAFATGLELENGKGTAALAVTRCVRRSNERKASGCMSREKGIPAAKALPANYSLVPL